MQPPIPNSYWLPGNKVVAGEYPGAWSPADARDRLRRLLDAGVRAFVNLTDPEDGLTPYEPALREEAEARGVAVTYHALPITDMGIPSRERMAEILDTIDAEVAEGRVVYVHCWGGVGRTGTVVGCHLVRGGCAGGEALRQVAALFATMSAEKVAWHTTGSPQTDAQRAFVRAWREGARGER